MAPSSPPPGTASRLRSGHSPWLIYVLGALTTAIIIGVALLFLRWPAPPPIVVHPPPTPVPTVTPTPTATPSPITIFVSGAVHHPGVYELPPGARVADALAAAGGFTDEANPYAVNQAVKLWDEAQIHVPDQAEQASANPPAGVSGDPQPVRMGEVGDATSVNINTAGADELERLPGIGPEIAKRIIQDRPYSSIDDLDRVRGIGPKTIESLRDRVVTQ